MLDTVPLVLRTALLQRISVIQPRLVVLEAPGGYGKSTVARQITADSARTGIVDALGVADPVEYHRLLLDALTLSADPLAISPPSHAPHSSQALATWRELCVRAWHAPGPPGFVVFENAEELLDRPDILGTLSALFDRPQPARRAIFCTRRPVPIRFGRFAFPHEIVRFDLDDLRFSTEELAGLFRLAQESEELVRIEHFTRGWPIATLLVHRIRREGRRIDEQLTRGDSSVLCYLADEVLAGLSPSSWNALFVIAGLDDATRTDLDAALGDGATRALERLRSEAPFVDAYGASLQAHPLIKSLLRSRHPDALRTAGYRAAAGHRGAGRPLRSAEISLALGDAAAAAEAIAELPVAPWIAKPAEPLVAAVSKLGRDVLVAHPALWAFAMVTARGEALPTHAWLHEGLEVWSRHVATMSDEVALGIGSRIIGAYAKMGMFAECDRWLAELRRRDPRSLIVAVWTFTLDAMRGRTVDVGAFEREVLARLDEGPAKIMALHEGCARVYRVRGERDAERAAAARAIDTALRVRSSVGLTHAVTDAAFGAWLAGEEELYEQYLRLAEAHATPARDEGVRYFLDCARGRGSAACPGYEKLKTRAHASLIAAGLAAGEERRALLRRAREAADQSAQPFVRILTRVAAAVGESDAQAWSEALALAEALDSPQLRAALDELADGGSGRMLAPLARRFRRSEEPAPRRADGEEPAQHAAARIRRPFVSLSARVLYVGEQGVALSSREAELLLALVVHRSPRDRRTLGAMLWPDQDESIAARNVNVYVARLRKRLGSLDLIESRSAGYALRERVDVDLFLFEEALATGTARVALAPPLEAIVTSRHERLPQWLLTAEWLAPYVRRFEEAIRRIRFIRAAAAEEAGDRETARRYYALVAAEDADEAQASDALARLARFPGSGVSLL